MRILTSEIANDVHLASRNGTTPGPAMLTLVLGAILVVRIFALLFSATDLHYEEAQYWFWARDLDFGYDGKPPILFWMLGLATATCGDSEICIRLPFPIIATASGFLTYALARRLYDRRIAVWAAIVYATLPAVSAFALVAMPQGILAFFLIAGLLMLTIHFDRPSIWSGFGLGIIVGLGLMTDHTMIYLPICTVLYLAATPPLRHLMRAPGTWLAGAIILLAAAPDLLWFVQNELTDLRQSISNTNWTFWRFNPDATLVFIVLQFVLFGPILLFVLLRSVVARHTLAPRAAADRFLLFHSIPILTALLVQAFFFKTKAHWALPAFPAAAVLVSALMLRNGFKRLLMISTGLHIAIFAGIIALSLFAERFAAAPAFNRLVGWHDFAEGLDSAAALSEIETIVLRGGDQVSETIYYLRDTDLEIRAFNPRGRNPSDDFERRRSWAYGDLETILLATPHDPSAFGIPLGNADKIGEFPVQSYLSSDGVFSLYRVNPPAETGFPR